MLFWAAPMNIFVFDIETVPDTDGGRRVLELGDDLSDSDDRYLSTGVFS